MSLRLWISIVVGALALLSPGCQTPPEAKPPSKTPAAPPAPMVVVVPNKSEPIYFLKGDGTLSPGAISKLKGWVEAWGAEGSWVLTIPSGPGLTYDLLERRVLAIRNELRKLGVTRVETVLGPAQPPGPYDSIFILKTRS